MGVYNLNDTNYLKHDLEDVLKSIQDLYSFTLDNGRIGLYPNRFISKDKHWTSPESNDVFNSMIPVVKSVHKNMYALVETISRSRFGKFSISDFENSFDHFREFRLLNNKFKHFNDQSVEISLSQFVLLEAGEHRIDVCCNFKYQSGFKFVRYGEFVMTFFIIMEHLDAMRLNVTG